MASLNDFYPEAIFSAGLCANVVAIILAYVGVDLIGIFRSAASPH